MLKPMLKPTIAVLVLLLALASVAQTPPPPVTDISNAEIHNFINALPRNAVSDRPIRVVGRRRLPCRRLRCVPAGKIKQEANLHQTKVTEIYYILKGTGTLVTGGTLPDPHPLRPGSTTLQSTHIEGGHSRKVSPGDVVIIPGHTPHWFSSQNGDLEYLIFRPIPTERSRSSNRLNASVELKTQDMATTVSTQTPQSDTSFFGHPRGLATLFFTEMWERFSYYGMRAILILFMTAPAASGGLGFSVATAGVDLRPLHVHGLPDERARRLDRRPHPRPAARGALRRHPDRARTIHAWAFPACTFFYTGLVLLVFGTGLLKPNVSTIVGQLYTGNRHAPRRRLLDLLHGHQCRRHRSRR